MTHGEPIQVKSDTETHFRKKFPMSY